MNNNEIQIAERHYSDEDIRSRIFTIRNQQVMLDKDLALLYGVETKYLNRAVKRNTNRFPDDFMFQLTKDEITFINGSRCQNGTLNNDQTTAETNTRGKNIKYLPFAFTEAGISQLSGVLHSPIAIEMNIRIVRAFVAMRRIISANAGLYQRIENIERKQIAADTKIDEILDRMEELSPKSSSSEIFDTGCVWDAWSYVSELIRSAENRIILIDNYVDDRVLAWCKCERHGHRSLCNY